VPYTGNQAQIRESSTYDSQRVLLVIPPTMQISSTGFNAAGTEQGFNVFSKETVKAGNGFDVSVSGTAPPPSEASASGSSSGDQVNGRDSGAPESTLETAPARLGDEKWILLGGLAAIFAVGVGLLLRKPVIEEASAPVPSPTPKGRKAQRAAQQTKVAPSAPPAAPVAPMERVTLEVNSNLDSLKDTLLRLELRRQAGTITDADYALERGRAEQLLRDLVQG
jgi:hypothetical protein